MIIQMKSLKKIVLILSSVFLLSGCSFFEDNKEEKQVSSSYIELEGTLIDENSGNFSFSKFSLLNTSGEKIADLESNTENLSDFLNTSVFVKGKKIDDTESLHLNVVQIATLPSHEKKVESKALGVSLVLPSFFTAEEKNKRFHIIKKKTEEQFFTVFWQKNLDWQEKFLKEGEKIIIKDFDVRRIYAGKRIQLYFPKYEIQIDYWGEKNGEYDFYKILDTLKFFNKTESFLEKNKGEMKEDKKTENKNPENSSAEVSRDTNDIEKNKNTESQKIITLIENTLKETKNSVKKISIYQNYADVEISEKLDSGEIKKQRIVYKISGNTEGKNPTLTQVAEFKEGEVQSWDLISGEIPDLAGESEIFLRDIEDVKPIVLPENFALYVSTHFDFQVGYPRSMYYKATGKTEKSLASVNWSSSPITSENSEIRLEILEGEISEEKILEDENTIIFPRDSKTHFKFSALHDNFGIVQKMKKNFRNEK